ncbi:MAG: hypothetical protein E5V37_26755 [Mesorhizobium sp.]|nr:MAG: hypothetical protein E5V37_26755 [Mesorhizobium sp.]
MTVRIDRQQGPGKKVIGSGKARHQDDVHQRPGKRDPCPAIGRSRAGLEPGKSAEQVQVYPLGADAAPSRCPDMGKFMQKHRQEQERGEYGRMDQGEPGMPRPFMYERQDGWNGKGPADMNGNVPLHHEDECVVLPVPTEPLQTCLLRPEQRYPRITARTKAKARPEPGFASFLVRDHQLLGLRFSGS